MGKGPPEWWEKVKKWAREQATTAFWLAVSVFSVLLLWVAFGSKDNCTSHGMCWLLGVTDKTEAIKLLGFAIAGVMASWGVVAANRRSDAMVDTAKATAKSAKAAGNTAKATAKSAKAADNTAKATAKSAKAAADTAKAAADTAKATESGNRQRAFKDGVEHLGSEKPSVRQGGAHALFHLALEDERLRASIAGVLCAHIRETTGDKDYQERNKDKPSTEMQSLLRLLFTTETVDEGRLERFWEGITPDLNGGYFCGVKLEGAQFRGAKLHSAQFQGASLGEAQFQQASLWRAQFQRALLWGVQFQGVLLWGVQFQGADLRRAQFQGADLRRAKFQGANLERAQFQGASLEGARFQGADLERAQFQGARLSGSEFQGASLYMAGFQQAQFGQEPEHEGNPALGHTAAGFDDLVKQLKASAFHGVSSGRIVPRSFAEKINHRTDKESDFSGVIFFGGMTEELLAEVKAALERGYWFILNSGFGEKLIQHLESEISQPESNTRPKEVIAGSYGKEDAELWIHEFREAMATVP